MVLEWVNHGCPFVIKHYDCGNMQAVQKKYTDKGVVWLSICSSAPGKQGHMSNEEWVKENKAKKGAATAVLIDEDGAVGHMYKARTTPHMFIIDPKGNITYEGAIDDNPRGRKPAQVKAAKNYVAMVLDAVMAGKPAPVTKTKAYGCSVKYAGKGMKKGRRGGGA